MCVRVCVNRTTIVISPRLPSYTYLPFSQKQAPRRQPTKLSSARYLLEPLARKCAQVLSIHAQFSLLFSFFLRFFYIVKFQQGDPTPIESQGSLSPRDRRILCLHMCRVPSSFVSGHRKDERTCVHVCCSVDDLVARTKDIIALFLRTIFLLKCSYFILKLKRTHTLSVLAPVVARPVEYSGELYICLYVIFDLKKYI